MMRKVAFLGSAALIALGGITPAAAQFRAALDESRAAIDEGSRSQKRIQELDEQATELLAEFRANIKQRDAARQFNASRAVQIENQLETIRELQQDIDNLQSIQRAVTPLMETMLNRLEQFVEADTPFLIEERRARIVRLRGAMTDATQTEASRYNLIMEAYQIENEYGRTFDYYEAEVDIDGEPLKVEFLRIGRVALIYKNANDTILRIFNTSTREFEDLDMSFLPGVRQGLRMAKELAPPNLLEIPVTAPIDLTAAQ